MARAGCLWGSDLVEPGGSGHGVTHGGDGAVASDRGQESPVAGGQIGPVKDPVSHSGPTSEGAESIASGGPRREGDARGRDQHEIVGIAIPVGGKAQRTETVELQYGWRAQGIICRRHPIVRDVILPETAKVPKPLGDLVDRAGAADDLVEIHGKGVIAGRAYVNVEVTRRVLMGVIGPVGSGEECQDMINPAPIDEI